MRRNPPPDLELLALAAAQAQAAAELAAQLAGLEVSSLLDLDLGPVPDPPPLPDIGSLPDLPPLAELLGDPPPLPELGWGLD